MTLQGKGLFTWKIPNCEHGDPIAIAAAAKIASLTHVLLKIADGTLTYNGNWGIPNDLVTPVAQALRSLGIQVWGWHYVYGNDPLGEANRAIQRIRQFNLDGYVIDAEAEYKQDGKKTAARKFMNHLRSALPDLTIALSSYRYPSLHPQLPWREFLELCDLNMPQVYWMKAHNPGEQLARCVREFQSMTPTRPIVPTGSAFREHGWQPTSAEVLEFLQAAKNLNLNAVNFWEWSETRSGFLPGVWEMIRDYPWSTVSAPKDICEKYITTLNSRNLDQLLGLYTSTAVHITAARTIQGLDTIRSWYQQLLGQILPNAVFTLTGYSGTGNSRHLTWTATSSRGVVYNGNDTFGLLNDRINYHYSFFTVTR
jgi:hypothetical protein